MDILIRIWMALHIHIKEEVILMIILIN